MKLLEFALASYSLEGTDAVDQKDTTDTQFSTAELMLKKKAKWRNLKCPTPTVVEVPPISITGS